MPQVRIVKDKYQVRICKDRYQVRTLLARCLTSLHQKSNILSLLLILASRQHSSSQRLLVSIASSLIINSRMDQCKQGKWTRNKVNSIKVMVNINKAVMVNKGCFTRISDMKKST